MATQPQTSRNLEKTLKDVAQDLQSIKSGEAYINNNTWGQEGSAYLLLPLKDFRGVALFFHMYPEGQGAAGTLRLKNYDRMRAELASERPGGEIDTEDPYLVMHGHTPNSEAMQYLFTTTAKLFDDEVYVNRLALSKDGVDIEAGTPSYKRFGELVDFCNRWNNKDIRIEKMHLDKRRMINDYANSLG